MISGLTGFPVKQGANLMYTRYICLAMFTGIIEALGRVESLEDEGSNRHFTISCPFTEELKIDQSLAHNGACLTVTSVDSNQYSVTAIHETLERTNLGKLKKGDLVNLERCMLMNGRIDGHLVQGHIDQTGIVKSVKDENGSWKIVISYDKTSGHLTVPKGSVCVNGVSLTVVDAAPGEFSIAIIPYTWKHTTFNSIRVNDAVNLEFDIIGKYVRAYTLSDL
jgi:riboflavin synthase